MATWTPGSPVLGDTISQSFNNIRDNWTVLANAWTGDHQSLTGDGTSSTQHTKVTMPANAGAIGATPGIGKLYTKDVDGGGVIELVYENEAGTEIQLTKGTPVGNTTGETALPGGMGMKWGLVVITTPGSQTYTYASLGLSDFDSATYSCVATPTDRSRSVGVLSFTKSEIRLGISGSVAGSIYFMAVGK